MSAAAVCYGSWRLTLDYQISLAMSVDVARFGMRVARISSYLMSAAVMCYGLAVDVFKDGNVCCLPAPVHQPFSSNTCSLDLRAREEA